MNTRVGRIARWQAHLGGFVASPSPSLEDLEDKDDDDGFDDDDDVDEDASFSSDEKMTISQWLPFVIHDKKGK